MWVTKNVESILWDKLLLIKNYKALWVIKHMITIFCIDFGYQVLKAFFNVCIIVETWIKLLYVIIVVWALILCKLTLNKILLKQLEYVVDFKWLIIVVIIMQEHKVWSALKIKHGKVSCGLQFK